MATAIAVSVDTVDLVVGSLPRPARLAFNFAARLRRGTLEAVLPNGQRYLFGGAEPGPAATMIINNLDFARRLISGGDLGVAEGYLRGEWETPNLTQFLYLFNVNHDVIAGTLCALPLIRLFQSVRFWLHRNTRSQAKRNIEAHYDLGNRFYEAWLDETMTYSSALFEHETDNLSVAQTRKYQSLATAIGLAPGQKVLEIGCGWGGFAEFAAKTHGVDVVALTISPKQFDFARQRVFNAGLNDKVEVKLQDYRDERGVFDRIASIEMIEAVGEQYWSTYFRQMRDRLVPGGFSGIQAITIQDRYFRDYRREIDFIRHYVFPGGMLPTPTILKTLGQKFDLLLVSERIFGRDYARTLSIWRDHFRASWPALVRLGFDQRFQRLWEYYLAYCEAGFLADKIDVRQMVFAKSGG
jgi:cyclopropane-fatty-acyl-phospholipid synthase